MKKFLTFVFVAALAGAVTTASATDRTHKLGLGYQEVLTSNIVYGSVGGVDALSSKTMGSWSVKYGLSPAVNFQFAFGMDLGNKSINDRLNLGARLLYDFVESENSDFYSGLGLVYDRIDKNAQAIRINVPLGFEFSFAGLPEIGFSAEAGFMFDYTIKGDKTASLHTIGGNVGGNLGLGVHYYF